MIATFILVAFAAVTSTAGHRVLTRAQWVRRFPAAGIWAWQTLTVSVVLCLALGGLTLAIPLMPGERVAAVMQLSPLELAHHYPNPGGAVLAALAAGTVSVLLLRVLVLTVVELRRAGRERRSQRTSLEMVGSPHPDGYLVLSHPAPLVYCLPGRQPRIVVTSGAVSLLTTQQLALVLAHERVHLRVRHDLALAFATALARTFAWWPLLTAAPREIGALAEMQADDVVRVPAERQELARALAAMRLSGAPMTSAPGPALTGTQVTTRVRRLARTPVGHGRVRAGGTAIAGLALMATPVALALAPAFEAATTGCCVYAGAAKGDQLLPVVVESP